MTEVKVGRARSFDAGDPAATLIDSRRLFYFYHVARLGSFSGAETALGIAQPALTRQIQVLESELGCKLLERNGAKGVSITQGGEALYAHAEAILTEMQDARASVRTTTQQLSGELTVAAPTFFTRDYMHAVVQGFMAKHPEVRLKVIEAATGQIHELLASGQVDVAVATRLPGSLKAETIEVMREPMYIAVGAGHPWAKKAWIGAKELKGQPFVLPASVHGVRAVIEAYCAAQGVELEARLEVDSLGLMESAVRSMGMAGFLRKLERDDESIRLIPLRPALIRSTYVAQLRQSSAPSKKALVEEIVAITRAVKPPARQRRAAA